jgi:hypothetical protein
LTSSKKIDVRLGNWIEGRCTRLECCISESEQHIDERLISLKMAHAEAETDRVKMEKQFRDLKLEVHRINRFFERESMAHPQQKSGIINSTESASPHPPSDVAANGPNGHRIEHQRYVSV